MRSLFLLFFTDLVFHMGGQAFDARDFFAGSEAAFSLFFFFPLEREKTKKKEGRNSRVQIREERRQKNNKW